MPETLEGRATDPQERLVLRHGDENWHCRRSKEDRTKYQVVGMKAEVFLLRSAPVMLPAGPPILQPSMTGWRATPGSPSRTTSRVDDCLCSEEPCSRIASILFLVSIRCTLSGDPDPDSLSRHIYHKDPCLKPLKSPVCYLASLCFRLPHCPSKGAVRDVNVLTSPSTLCIAGWPRITAPRSPQFTNTSYMPGNRFAQPCLIPS
ncbi:hypothetical protein V8C44DRAFT_187808 [Trichoderma aethiopicum]